MTYAKIIADSVGPNGVRLTTMEVEFHRFVLAEFNTHRAFSRNSASSRAIPLRKQLQRIEDSPAVPTVWASEQKGMQGGDEIEDPQQAETWWKSAALNAAQSAQALANLGVHKSLANRLLEPFMHHTVVCTSTSWENFFEQRCSPLAQPEIRVAAEEMRSEYLASDPVELAMDEWHLPYIRTEDVAEAKSRWYSEGHDRFLTRISAARCARVSYLTQSGDRDLDEDLRLYDRLTTASPPHWSPLEHVATPWPLNHLNMGLPFVGIDGEQQVSQADVPYVGNLLGWRSLRTEVEAQLGQGTFR